MATPEPLLRIGALEVRYGRIPALEAIDLAVAPGEVVGLLGANGAGKTTVLNTVCGFICPVSGEITLRGARIDGLPPHRIVRLGALQVSQERDLFGELTVMDNLKLGALVRGKETFRANLERVFGYFPRLEERRDQRAHTMSGGEQQMLAIGRALMGNPQLLLLDEPSSGLAPIFVQEIAAMLVSLKQAGDVSMILVEQSMSLAAQVVDRFHILKAGRMVAQGPASALQGTHEDLAQKFYL